MVLKNYNNTQDNNVDGIVELEVIHMINFKPQHCPVAKCWDEFYASYS